MESQPTTSGPTSSPPPGYPPTAGPPPNWTPPPGYPPPGYGYPPPAKKRHRVRNTILIVGALFTILIIILAAAGSSTTHPSTPGVQTNSYNQAHPPQADVNPGWTLATDQFGYATISGTVTNHSSKTSTYAMHFDLIGANGVRVADAIAVVNEVQPGQTANFESLPAQATGAHAVLTKVDRSGF